MSSGEIILTILLIILSIINSFVIFYKNKYIKSIDDSLIEKDNTIREQSDIIKDITKDIRDANLVTDKVRFLNYRIDSRQKAHNET